MDIIVENVRCFSGQHVFPMRPLTILLGENSTGKSTLLAVLATLSRLYSTPMHTSFNDPPYDMGGYDTIAAYDAQRRRRPAAFRIGVEDDVKGSGGTKQHARIVAEYGASYGKVVLRKLDIESNLTELKLAFRESVVSGSVAKRSKSGSRHIVSRFSGKPPKGLELLPLVAIGACTQSGVRQTTKGKASDPRKLDATIRTIVEATNLLDNAVPSISSMAPIRTKPRRTHDRLDDEFKPEGDHTPARLRHIYLSRDYRELRQRVVAALQEFGDSSGLFTDVTIVPLGARKTSPFQVLVTLGKQKFNLVDVGYGVSQSLPILVQTVLEETGDMLLLQQPEVHLHPKAQAALGSFFARMVKFSKSYLVVETHSDYLVDRVRQEVARKTIGPDDVAILFFEKEDDHVAIHPLKLDDLGNILESPPGYRSFFLQEELALLNRGSS